MHTAHPEEIVFLDSAEGSNLEYTEPWTDAQIKFWDDADFKEPPVVDTDLPMST